MYCWNLFASSFRVFSLKFAFFPCTVLLSLFWFFTIFGNFRPDAEFWAENFGGVWVLIFMLGLLPLVPCFYCAPFLVNRWKTKFQPKFADLCVKMIFVRVIFVKYLILVLRKPRWPSPRVFSTMVSISLFIKFLFVSVSGPSLFSRGLSTAFSDSPHRRLSPLPCLSLFRHTFGTLISLWSPNVCLFAQISDS